jgi:hypothetical protein
VPLLPAVFAALHFGAGWGVVWEVIRGIFGQKPQGWQPTSWDMVDRC